MLQTGKEFLEGLAKRTAYQAAMHKKRSGLPLNDVEAALLANATPEAMGIKLCGCGCGEPLEPRIDGVRHTLDGKEVTDDCYFEHLGEIVEKQSLGRFRGARGC